MIRKVLIGGVTAAVIVGAGGAALAATTGGSTTGGTATTAATTAQATHVHGKKTRGERLLRNLDHATIVIDTKKHGDVTHDLIRGTVSAVSPSSITVVSADNTSETFTVNSQTKVRTRTDGKGAASTISKVATGDHVFVAGIGATDPVAKQIIDRGTSTK